MQNTPSYAQPTVSLSLMTCQVSGTSLSYAVEKLALPTLGHPYVYTSTCQTAGSTIVRSAPWHEQQAGSQGQDRLLPLESLRQPYTCRSGSANSV
jgi:hypothetical protein